MILTNNLTFLIIFSEILLFILINKALDIIKHCATAKAWKQAMTMNKQVFRYEDVKNKIEKMEGK